MKRVLFYAILATMFCCVACDDNKPELKPAPEDTGIAIDNSILHELFETDSLVLNDAGCDDRVQLVFYGRQLRGEELQQAFDDLNDNKYEGKKRVADFCSYATLHDLDLVSNQQFGDIKAGESIASKVMYVSYTIAPYIASGYKEVGVWTEELLASYYYFESGDSMFFFRAHNHELYTPIVKPLNEVKPEDTFLVPGWVTSLNFIEIPDIKEHTFTLTATTEKGEKISASVDFVFE